MRGGRPSLLTQEEPEMVLTSQNGTDRSTGAAAFPDRWQERQGIVAQDPNDPMSALRPANDDRARVAGMVPYQRIVAEPEPVEAEAPVALATGPEPPDTDFTNDLNLEFGDFNWFTGAPRAT